MRAVRSDGHLAAYEAGFLDLIARESSDIVEAASPEISFRHSRDPIPYARISIVIRYIYVRNIDATVEAAPAIISAPPPAIEWLTRRKRHPSDVPKAEAKAAATAKPRER